MLYVRIQIVQQIEYSYKLGEHRGRVFFSQLGYKFKKVTKPVVWFI